MAIHWRAVKNSLRGTVPNSQKWKKFIFFVRILKSTEEKIKSRIRIRNLVVRISNYGSYKNITNLEHWLQVQKPDPRNRYLRYCSFLTVPPVFQDTGLTIRRLFKNMFKTKMNAKNVVCVKKMPVSNNLNAFEAPTGRTRLGSPALPGSQSCGWRGSRVARSWTSHHRYENSNEYVTKFYRHCSILMWVTSKVPDYSFHLNSDFFLPF